VWCRWQGDSPSVLFDQEKFAFMLYPFVLLPRVKVRGLFFFNRVSMHQERRQALYDTMLHGAPSAPHLKLLLRRQHVLHDALAHVSCTNLVLMFRWPNALGVV